MAMSDKKTSLINGPEWFQRFAKGNSKSKWQPIPRFSWAVGFYVIVTVVALPLGGALFYFSKQNIDFTYRYDNFKAENNSLRLQRIREADAGHQSLLEITTDKKMPSPVYVYYELKDYYQNHKRYIRSKDPKQLGGDKPAGSDYCKPYQYAKNPEDDSIDQTRPILPCGLMAHSFFNDSFTLESVQDAQDEPLGDVQMEEKGIATEWDRKYLYGDMEAQYFNKEAKYRGGKTIDGPLDEDEHFMVWMRVGSRATVRKLYGIIHHDIPKGSKLTFKITHRYNTYDFDGQKRLILSTSNWTGGKNTVIGVVYFVIGALSAVACIIILGMDLRSNRKPGDLSVLSWNREERRVS